MNIFKNRTQIVNSSDAALVMASLGGDRDAFCEVVSRYQNLLCSLAYSSVGDIKYSEDIAQEAFVEAWKKLDTLREPEKLKSWLCGILRFKVGHFRRKEAKQPVKNADELDEQGGGKSEQTKIEDEAIREQQQTLLWQTLEKMPATYREPLILFYREDCSVEHVAEELDLSEDAVKQRLSRGRKLLQKAMMTFVEEALAESKPGIAFTTTVLAVINTISPPVKAATLAGSALKTGSLFSWTTMIVTLAAFSGLVSSFFGLRASLDQSRTQRERRSTIIYTSLFLVFALIYMLCIFTLKYIALGHYENAAIYAVVSQLFAIGFVVSYIVLLFHMLKGMRKLRAEERLFNPQSFLDESDQIDSKQREYKSSFCIAGVPLLHFRFGIPEKNDKPVFGWIAGGEQAYGLFFAWGGFAVAPISVGIISIGVISIGAVGLGLIGIGTIGIGIFGFGASAIAYKAYASLSALGWESAFSNGFSIAKEAAIGPIAFADHINNEQAAEISNLTTLNQSYLWVLSAIALLVIVPSALHSYKVRQRMGKK
jgi:RNA polymerase sigma factor (sigma-70 family)